MKNLKKKKKKKKLKKKKKKKKFKNCMIELIFLYKK